MKENGSLPSANKSDLMRVCPKQVLSQGEVIWRRFRTVTSAQWVLWETEDPAAFPGPPQQPMSARESKHADSL